MARVNIDGPTADSPYGESARLYDFRCLDIALRLAYDPPGRTSRNCTESHRRPTLHLLNCRES